MPNDSREKHIINKSPGFVFAYSNISVCHFDELLADIEKLDREGKLSDHTIYRQYLEHVKYRLPEGFPDAQSVIVLAVFTKPMLVDFCYRGKKHEIMVPPQYYDDGIAEESMRSTVLNEIIRTPGCKIERAKHVSLKLLAVRSGLGRYGRNNICYVDGMGSLLALYAYFTDFQFEIDNWHKIKMMDICADCEICISQCPTNSLSEKGFVIDAGKCLTLYNEIRGEFPDWIDPQAHNALMGCMRCQLCCPANQEVMRHSGRFEDITEEETDKIVEGREDEEVVYSLSRKLRMFSPKNAHDFVPILRRNLRVLLLKEGLC
jgi:epoxyqueuosine reductase